MSSLLARIGRWSALHPWRVLAAWMVVAVGAGLGVLTFGSALEDDFSIPGTESQEAYDTLEEDFPSAAGASLKYVVADADGGAVTGADTAAAVTHLAGELAAVDGVASAPDPFATGTVSPDATTALITVGLDDRGGEVDDATLDALDAVVTAAEAEGLTVVASGLPEIPEGSHMAEVVGAAIAYILMALTLGSLVAAGLPLASAGIALGISLAGIGLLSHVVAVPAASTALASMLGLAVGIDYALFIIVRLRAELAAGVPLVEAIAAAARTAGSAVVFAGVTVILAVVGLALTGVPFLAAMGAVTALAVAVAVAASLTALPALMGLLGERLRPRGTAVTRARGNGGWGDRLLRRPATVLVAGVLALGVVAMPVGAMSLALPDGGSEPAGSDERLAYDAISEAFGPGANGPLLVLADVSDSADPVAAGQATAATLAELDGVAAVQPPRPSEDGSSMLIAVTSETDPSSKETAALVDDIRDLESEVTATTGATIAVTGQTALAVDVADKLAAALVPFAVVICGLTLVLLMVVFRSILVPVTAALGFLLSLGAALGATVAVFQWGWAGDTITEGATGPLVAFLPILVMAVLFGLSMDYQVFLVSRIAEAHRKGLGPVESVRAGLTSVGRVVATAAAVMIAVFAAFVVSGDAMTRPLAFALLVGVALDAFVVRLTLVPAVLALLGERAWWLPAWLDRILPHVHIDDEPEPGSLTVIDAHSPADAHR
ncbi:MMPL family transporter [Demequina sp. NBRC 110055]|uniref:MMPL family transporter n=1 Tax=Demequina sp. NBRC 110055 TaxID=1570344 RepID=UPI000A075D55|nr:MMPL family transporter [Demequina sp. NBRC 110055]